MSRMSRTAAVAPATRAFLAVAALGAGLLHAALAPGAPLPLLSVLLGLALAELAWAVATLARDRPPLFGIVPALALVPLGLWAGLAVVGATASSGTVLTLPFAPIGTASLLDLGIAAVSAVVLRRRRPVQPTSGALRFVLALMLSACAVSAVTIPALGATDAGVAAVTVHHHH
ncbi:hypothetical protein [uncultured Leifsonia sp.]|uniref:hypothetical protein n=1 Tax=uncultured Leifsonia sp. TaxID=340359 RepID=UPI0025F52C98|nr:hypothetical protein [uncultured Leifsonia sp.]